MGNLKNDLGASPAISTHKTAQRKDRRKVFI